MPQEIDMIKMLNILTIVLLFQVIASRVHQTVLHLLQGKLLLLCHHLPPFVTLQALRTHLLQVSARKHHHINQLVAVGASRQMMYGVLLRFLKAQTVNNASFAYYCSNKIQRIV